jgi:hypothetical protein
MRQISILRADCSVDEGVRLKQKGKRPRNGTALGRIAMLLDEPAGLAVNLANGTALP